jgi:DNA-binding NarL/FixJ family response regulator
MTVLAPTIPDTEQAPSTAPGATQTSSREISVFLVEDQATAAGGVRSVLTDQPGLRVVGVASDPRAALFEIARTAPRVVVIDGQLTGESGLWLVAQLGRLTAPPRTVVYPAIADPTLAVAALVAGAGGIAGGGDELRSAIHAVAHGRPALPTLSETELDQLAGRLPEDDRPVLRMFARGVKPEETSRALRLSNRRLRAARARIVRELTRLLEPANARRLEPSWRR